MHILSPQRPLRRKLLLSLSALLLLLAAPYFLIPHYRFPEQKAFEGSAWYNPYATGVQTVKKLSFHIHSHAWGGVTDGRSDARLIDSVYRSYGYDGVSLSNYFHIDTLQFSDSAHFIPCYEQGYSIQKSHRLVVGASAVQWFDVVTPQTVSIKQFIFRLLHPTCDVLVMAHPAFGRPSYTIDNARELCDYDCMEVLNHYRNSLQHWDAALSAGRPAWLIANDDSHNARDDHETGVRWTLVCSPSTTRGEVCSALKRGAAFGVIGSHGQCDVQIQSINVINDSLFLSCAQPFRRCRAVGQDGRLLSQESNSRTLSIALHPNDHYCRLEIEGDSSTVFTNPVIRCDAQPSMPHADVDVPLTILFMVIYTALVLSLAYFAIKTLREAQNG